MPGRGFRGRTFPAAVGPGRDAPASPPEAGATVGPAARRLHAAGRRHGGMAAVGRENLHGRSFHRRFCCRRRRMRVSSSANSAAERSRVSMSWRIMGVSAPSKACRSA